MISNLPDDLIIHILYFLPTKDAIKTCILSSRWKTLWTLVPGLDFQLSTGYKSLDDRCKYIDFIKRAFRSHNYRINKFHITYTAQLEESHLFKDWINTAVKRNVEDICIFGFDQHMQLPESLFTSKTLVSLKLLPLHSFRNYFLKLDVPASICFPCLKVLHVKLFSPKSDLTEKLFCSSPVLEDLRINVFYKDSGEYMHNISCPSLKKLYINIMKKNSYGFNCVVYVDTPLLESLEVHVVPSIDFILKNSPTLNRARLGFWKKGDGFESEIVRLLESVSFVKKLSLGRYLGVPVFSISSENKWPAFPNVTHLTLDMRINFDLTRMLRWNMFPEVMHLRLDLHCNCCLSYLLKILSCLPNLSTLVINKISSSVEFFNLEQAKVPSCLGSHVKEIELLAFADTRKELKMIKYLLESAGALKKLMINMRGGAGMKGHYYWLRKEIEMLPTCSKECRIVFN